MYKITLILFFYVFVNTSAISQYITDPSFEDTLFCPLPNQMPLKHWYRPTWGSSDCFVENCFMPTYFGFESTKRAYHGKGFVGLVPYDSLSPNFSEYLETELITPLDSSIKYCITVYIVSSSSTNFLVDNLHIGFRSDSTFQGGSSKLNVDSYYKLQSNIILDTLNWNEYSIEFTANGTEKYLTIGNFDQVADLNVYSHNSQWIPPYLQRYAYYFFDLITLEECPPEPVEHFSVYPNPSSGGSVYLSNYADTVATVTLFNSLGQRVAERMLPAGVNGLVAFEGLASGVYIAAYQTASGYREEKMVVVLR